MSLKSSLGNTACRRQGLAGVQVPPAYPLLSCVTPALDCGVGVALWSALPFPLSGLGQTTYPLWASPSSSEQCANEDAHPIDCCGDQVRKMRSCLTPRNPKVGFSRCHAFFFPPDLSSFLSYLTVLLDFSVFLFIPYGKPNPKSEPWCCYLCDCTWAANCRLDRCPCWTRVAGVGEEA